MAQINQQKQRVCQILYSGLGGHGSVVFSLLNADTDHHYDHSLIFYGIEPTRDVYIQDTDRLLIPHTSILKKKGIDVRSWIKVYKALKLYQPDVLLFHSTSFLIVPVILFCFLQKTKLVLVEHNANAIKRKSEHFFSRLGGKFASKIILLSVDYQKEYLQKYGVKNNAKIEVINNGIDISNYQPSPQKLNGGKICISMIGRFSEQKDQMTLIKAVQQLNNPTVQLKFAGTGSLMASCEQVVKEANLENSVVFCGLLNEVEICSLLEETTIYVQASLGETMPISLMQAMACQLPVIGSNISGINNLIEVEKNGLLFEKSNVNQLAEQLNRLINDPELCQKIASEARKKAVNEFSQTRMFEGYKTVIDSL